jgi:ATP-binding cassette subfamily F protein 3
MISISNLSKNYGKKVLFREISFSINDGEKVGLIGPNGAGKSTFFSLSGSASRRPRKSR